MAFNAGSAPSGAGGPQPALPNLGAGIAAGVGAGIIGALVWGGFTGITHLRLGILAVGVGFLVAYAMTRFAHARGVGFGVTAAVITLVACAAGDVGTIYVKASHESHLSVTELMRIAGPFTVLRDDLSHDKFGAVFFAIAAWAAFRYAAFGTTRNLRGRGRAVPAPTYGQPTYNQPTYGQPTSTHPTYGQPTYGQPTYGQPTYPPAPNPAAPTYGQQPAPRPESTDGVAPTVPER